MATKINASDIDGLKPGDEQSLQYLAVVNNLKSMRSVNDEIVNAYILKANPDQSITFIVDDLYPEDPQGSAKIGEVYLTPDKLDIFAALSTPTASQVPYTDKSGSFMSGCTPIDDSVSGPLGNTTAVLGIDMESKDYVDITARGGLIVLTGIVSIILALGVI